MSSLSPSPDDHALARSLADFVTERALLFPGERPLVALSGGTDSCALLLLLCEAAALGLLPQPAGVAHFHHGMRGQDADADAGFCAALATRGGLSCVIGLGALANANEAEAREARYAFLQEAAQELGADVIATAHHADDQAETVLMRVFRGTSVSGLAGIPVRRGNIIRPLLFARRAQLEAYCAHHGVAVRHDPTNDNPRFPRRKVRTLLPELAESFNPRLTEALCRLSEHAAEDSAYLDMLAVEHRGTTDLRTLERPLRRRVILQRLWELTEGDAALREQLVTATWVARLEGLLVRGGTLNLPGDGWARVRQGSLVFAPQRQGPLLTDWRGELPVPGSVALLDQRSLSAVIAAPLPSPERQRRSLRVDCGTIPASLTVRTVRDGDRIAPLGMAGKTRLVRDLLREAKVPAELRASQLVVEAEGEILWVVGVAQAESTRVPEDATEVLLLEIHHEGP
ncbi:tRNA lysidine(34) synthetase TilS [Armatimonas rosea]|uniref:tRNA(Ile)-lysidine synthase n=1 Tax=Armatimonas rosea TaxID=685828 RepID=A0A7W9STB2_ARMRO|nr:tRNA(Ile)-lysidine synthase [Armatimonas rosea]